MRPSLIRVEADEATYNLHILIRFELEQALLSDDLPVADLPAAWNDKYGQYLGIRPPNDADGVLQDIHWSAGLVGYFPTYSLGNLYASQFFAQAEADLGPLDAQFARGEFQRLRDWLREKIHAHGQRYTRRRTGAKCHRQAAVARPVDRAFAKEAGAAVRTEIVPELARARCYSSPKTRVLSSLVIGSRISSVEICTCKRRSPASSALTLIVKAVSALGANCFSGSNTIRWPSIL